MRHLQKSRLWLALRRSAQPRQNADIRNTDIRDVDIMEVDSQSQPRLSEHSVPAVESKSNEVIPIQADTTSLIPNTGINTLPIEILQHIFFQLDLWSVLRCRRVCHLWNDCVPGDSPALRASMFLPSQATRTRTEPLTLHLTVHISAIFVDIYPCEPPLVYTMCLEAAQMTHLQEQDIAIHPILVGTVDEHVIRKMKDIWNSSLLGQDVGSATWMHMLACYPPVQNIRLRFEYENDIPYPDYIWPELHALEGEVGNIKGVLLGELLSEIYTLINID
jgi:hypothetical protein